MLSIDIHPRGTSFISGGMDTSIKIWNLCSNSVVHAIHESYNHYSNVENHTFKTVIDQVPLFTTNQVHSDYVDCCLWYGNCLITKSTRNRIVLWSPDNHRYKNAPLILREMEMADTELWFVKFDVSVVLNLVALGNKLGKVYVFSLDATRAEKLRKIEIAKNTQCTERFSTIPVKPLVVLNTPLKCSTIRQIRFSPTSEYLVAVSDDGSVYVWRVLLD